MADEADKARQELAASLEGRSDEEIVQGVEAQGVDTVLTQIFTGMAQAFLPDKAGAPGGIDHFGFRLTDKTSLDAAIDEVERSGGRLIDRGEHAPGRPYAYVTDPDGYMIEL